MPRRGRRERYRSAKKVPMPDPRYRHHSVLDPEFRSDVLKGAARERDRPPPRWPVKGARVDYHGIIGREVTKPDCVVLQEPWHRAGCGWVTLIDKVRGWVACDALSLFMSPPKKDPTCATR